MAFIKTARSVGRCGKCQHFEKAKNICNHKDMDEMEVWPESVAPCGGKFYLPVDDYEEADKSIYRGSFNVCNQHNKDI